jgi:hypothetical protein
MTRTQESLIPFLDIHNCCMIDSWQGYLGRIDVLLSTVKVTSRMTVSVFWCRVTYFFDIYCPAFVVRPLWREFGSVVCHSESAIVSRLSVCTQVFTNIQIRVHTLYLKPLSVQARYSKLCPASSSSRYHGSPDTWTVVHVTAAKFKPLIYLFYSPFTMHRIFDTMRTA